MKTVCAVGPTVKGVDVSKWQQPQDWQAFKANGVEFAFIKATEGTTIVDHMYTRHKVGARAAGLLIGAYHFFHPKYDPKAQAQLFASTVGACDLGFVMDWETTNGVPSAADQAAGHQFLQTVEGLTKRVPIIYTSPYFAQSLALDPAFAKYPLWVAHYGVKCPLVPQPWAKWTFWQYSDKGLDFNLFNGTGADLKKLVA